MSRTKNIECADSKHKTPPSILVENRLNPNQSRAEESMSEMLQSKRELFLLQLSIDLVNDEVKKLECFISKKKESIADNEQLLAYNTENFKTNAEKSDQKTQKFIKDVHIVNQRRLDMLKEVRRLNMQILETRGGIRECKGFLEESLQFSKFLNSMTPVEWVIDQKRDKKERQEKRRYDRIIRRQEGWRIENAKNVSSFKVKFEQDLKNVSKNRRNGGKQDKARENYLAELERLNKEDPPAYEDEPITSSDDELPMYFTKPEQLMDVIALLERENIALIQRIQASEQTAEALKVAYLETVSSMDSELQGLHLKIHLQKENIAKAESMKLGTQIPPMKSCDSEIDKAFEILRRNMKQVYVECGFNDNISISSIQSMLMKIELRQEQILESLAAIPLEYVKKSEKEREKKRMEWKRLQNQKQQRKVQEEKNKKYLERSLQPTRKKTGPPVSTILYWCKFSGHQNILNLLIDYPSVIDIFSDNVSLGVT